MTQNSKHGSPVGLAWYRAGEWEDLKAFCEDGSKLEESYEEWKRNAEKALRDIERQGFYVERIDFDLDEFKKWCRANQKQPIGISRSEFAVMKLHARGGSKTGPLHGP